MDASIQVTNAQQHHKLMYNLLSYSNLNMLKSGRVGFLIFQWYFGVPLQFQDVRSSFYLYFMVACCGQQTADVYVYQNKSFS